jgi:hypothetical protein
VVGNWGKSLHRKASSEKISFVGAHKPNGRKDYGGEFRINLPDGEPHAQNETRSSIRPSFHLAQVNHCALRSFDSCIVKRARCSLFRIDEAIDLEHWNLFDRARFHDDPIRSYDEGTARWMDLFRKDARLM